MLPNDKYFVIENIHKSQKDLTNLEWVKAPYYYRFYYRFISSLAILISMLMIVSMACLLIVSWNETPQKKSRLLIRQQVVSSARDIINNAPLVIEGENLESKILPSLLKSLNTADLGYYKSIDIISSYLENNDQDIPSLSELRNYAQKYIHEGQEKLQDKNKNLLKLNLPTDPQEMDWRFSDSSMIIKGKADNNPSTLAHKRNVFNEMLKRRAYVYSYYKNNRTNQKYIQIEGIKDTRIEALAIKSRKSELIQRLHFKFPFFALLHYTKEFEPVPSNPYVDDDAPFQFICSNENLAYEIFNADNIIDPQAVLRNFNVIYNFQVDTILIDQKLYNFYIFDSAIAKELHTQLRAYFTNELQVYMNQTKAWDARKTNLILGLRIMPEDIYSLDSRPLFDNEKDRKFLNILNSKYNSIARAELVEQTFPYMFAILFLGLVIFVFFFVQLCIYAGYKANSHGEIPKNALPSALFKLHYIDYLPIEILSLATLASIIYLFSTFIYDVSYGFFHVLGSMVLMGGISIVFVLSLIRRSRGQVLYAHSIISFMQRIFFHLNQNWRWTLAYAVLLFIMTSLIWMNNYMGMAIIIGILFLMGLSFLVDIEILRQRIQEILGKKFKRDKNAILPKAWFVRSIDKDLNELEALLNSSMMSKLKTEKLKTELITNVSHDLKTPLTSIINYANILRKTEGLQAESQEYIERIFQNSMKLQTLTENLLEASKAASGNLPCEKIVLDLNEFLKQVCGEWLDRFDEEEIKLFYRIYDENSSYESLSFNQENQELGEEQSERYERYARARKQGLSEEEADEIREERLTKPFYVEVDPDLLVRIIDNLLGNSLKYSLPKSRVFINLKISEDDIYKLEIINTSKQRIDVSTEQLMERFIQGDISRRSEGAGLGLSIVKSLADLMNIKFDVTIAEDRFIASLNFKKGIFE